MYVKVARKRLEAWRDFILQPYEGEAKGQSHLPAGRCPFIGDTGCGQRFTVSPQQVGFPLGPHLPRSEPVSRVYALITGLGESRVRRSLLCRVEVAV